MEHSPQFPKLLNWRQSLKPADIESMLELCPVPILLVDQRNQKIYAANTEATLVTAYTRAELRDRDIRTLIKPLPPLPGQDPTPNSGSSSPNLVKRNQTTEPVNVSWYELRPGSRFTLLSFEPSSRLDQRERENQRKARLMESMQRIVQSLHMPQLNPALNQAMEAAQTITGASSLAIYLQPFQKSEGELSADLILACGEEEIFPSHLDGQEVLALLGPKTWTYGKRPDTTINRNARANNWQIVASTPLGQPQAWIGVLVAANQYTLKAEPLLQQLGAISGVISALIAIHSRHENLSSLLASSKQAIHIHQLIEDSIDDGVILLTTELRIQRINRAAEIILGYEEKETLGHPWQDILIGSDALSSLVEIALQGVATLEQENIHLYRRSGESFLAEVSAIPIQPDSTTEAILILLRDISEQERILAQTRRLEQRAFLGEFTAVFAHEVRNPINNISTGLQFLAFNLPEGDPNREVILRLQQDTNRLTELMKSVLSYSRQVDYEMAPVDLGQLLTRLVDRLQPRLLKNKVQHHLFIDPQLPQILGNTRALEQVFTNLITNATQAMGKTGGMLTIKIHSAQENERTYVEVTVADEGPGIPPDILERIFQPFYTTKSSGTGLGLAITKRIVTAHKGVIRVKSFAGGTIFYVQFPTIDPA